MIRDTLIKRYKVLKSRVGLKRIKGLSPKSKKQEQKDREWNALVKYLIIYRAHGRDELDGRTYGRSELGGHHIIPRRFNIHNAGNCFILSGRNHDHSRWGPGMPVPAAQALVLVAKLNDKYGIDPKMTGADVIRMEKNLGYD